MTGDGEKQEVMETGERRKAKKNREVEEMGRWGTQKKKEEEENHHALGLQWSLGVVGPKPDPLTLSAPMLKCSISAAT